LVSFQLLRWSNDFYRLRGWSNSLMVVIKLWLSSVERSFDCRSNDWTHWEEQGILFTHFIPGISGLARATPISPLVTLFLRVDECYSSKAV
jgi:hypothetical protein